MIDESHNPIKTRCQYCNYFYGHKKNCILYNEETKIEAGSLPVDTNLCPFCGKCSECEHPYWECPVKRKYEQAEPYIAPEDKKLKDIYDRKI